MGVAYVANERRILAFAAAALLTASLSLGGCATSTAGSSLMDARAEATEPPKTGAYLPVEVSPPARDEPTMTIDERSKLKKELLAAQDRQAAIAKAQGAPPAETVKPQ
jgi:hypothetical protein